MKHRLRPVALMTMIVSLLGCGAVPDAPTAPPPPSPVEPAPIPIVIVPAGGGPPVPAPPPCANGNLPVARFGISVHSVRDLQNELRLFSPFGPFRVGETVRFDAQGWDLYGNPTNGCDNEGPAWSWGPDDLLDWNGRRGWMPSAKIARPGFVYISATFDGVPLAGALQLGLID
jgi:hypothetical protein